MIYNNTPLALPEMIGIVDVHKGMWNELLFEMNMKQKQLVTYNHNLFPIYLNISSLCHWTLRQSTCYIYIVEEHEINMKQKQFVIYNPNLCLIYLNVSSLCHWTLPQSKYYIVVVSDKLFLFHVDLVFLNNIIFWLP